MVVLMSASSSLSGVCVPDLTPLSQISLVTYSDFCHVFYVIFVMRHMFYKTGKKKTGLGNQSLYIRLF